MASDGLSAAAISAYLDSRSTTAPPAEHVRVYRQAAAVLAAIRDPGRLRPLGDAPPGAAADLLRGDLILAPGGTFNGQVMLAPAVRASTIGELVSTGRVEAALAVNPEQRDSPLQHHFERYLRQAAPPLPAQTLDELDATLQVSVWLAGIVEGVPSVGEVNARAGYLRLLAPFEVLAGDAVFRGRQRELRMLRRYVDVIDADIMWPAMSISGIGGAGKSSLVARFMLENARLPDDERLPFGYLDFARASLDVGDTAGIFAELARQLELQFPGSAQFSELIRATEAVSEYVAVNHFPVILNMLHNLLGPRPYVVVLDTFEEVQYRGEERAHPLWRMLADAQNEAPNLRVLVAGRAPVESLLLAGGWPDNIVLGDLDDEAAMAFLAAQGIADYSTRRRLIETFGRLPLSLKLVGALAARTDGGAAALLGLSGPAIAASDEVIQAQLYGRFLDHVSDERIRRLAHPGLTLRRVNPALILEVLNEPCGLGIRTIDEAQDLFEELRRESSLVSVDHDDGDLVHRPDLRRVMLKMLLTGAPAQVTEIRRRAAVWYGRRKGRRNQAEDIYHRLHLDAYVSPRELDDRAVRASIQEAIEEFPVQTQLWLSSTGLDVPENVLEQATRDQAHASIAALIEKLLPYGPSSVSQAEQEFSAAYQSLDEDRARENFGPSVDLGASPVFRAGARIFAQRGYVSRAFALVENGMARAVRDGAASLTLGLVKELAWLDRNRPTAERAAGLALLCEHARRHQDLGGLIQHRAQTVIARDPSVVRSNLAAIGDLLSNAEPRDLWDLLPALRDAIMLAQRFDAGRLLFSHLYRLVTYPGGLFGDAVFPDPAPQVALAELLSSRYDDDYGRETAESGSAFLRLCDVWPYRILYVEPPYGRRGEQLSSA